MTGRSAARTLLVPLLLAATVVACSSSGPASPSSGPSAAPASARPAPVVPVTTEADAWRAVVAAKPQFAGFLAHDPSLIGQSGWWDARPASGVGAFVVTVSAGWGDCQSGCIDTHTWTYAVTPDGAVRLLSETGPVVPPDVLAPDAGAGRTGTGIAGHAAAGPVCPVESNPPDPACAPRPVAGAVIRVTDPSGAEVATATTDELGAYVVILPPGDYFVTADPVDGLMGTPEPIPAAVAPDVLVTVDLTYDTGIR